MAHHLLSSVRAWSGVQLFFLITVEIIYILINVIDLPEKENEKI